jgi:hypothetical protein
MKAAAAIAAAVKRRFMNILNFILPKVAKYFYIHLAY